MKGVFASGFIRKGYGLVVYRETDRLLMLAIVTKRALARA